MLEGKYVLRAAAPFSATRPAPRASSYPLSILYLYAASASPLQSALARPLWIFFGSLFPSHRQPPTASFLYLLPIPYLRWQRANRLQSALARPLWIFLACCFPAIASHQRPASSISCRFRTCAGNAQTVYNPHLRDPYRFFFSTTFPLFPLQPNTRSQRPTTMPGECYNGSLMESERA
jgi:hypothetical protein